jgi:hypothetical protein
MKGLYSCEPGQNLNISSIPVIKDITVEIFQLTLYRKVNQCRYSGVSVKRDTEFMDQKSFEFRVREKCQQRVASIKCVYTRSSFHMELSPRQCAA